MGEINITRVLEITKEFLDIPSCIGYEKPFLNYLNKRVNELGYETILKENYLVVKPIQNKNSKYLFSVHIDRHGVVKNKNNEVEYLGFYLKKKLGEIFRREEQEEDEIKLQKLLNERLTNFDIKLIGDYLRFKSDEIDLKFVRQGGSDFFEKCALRYVGEDIVSYNKETGNRLNEYKIKRYNLDIKNKLVTFDLNREVKDEDEIFILKSQLELKNDLFYGQIDNVISAAVLFYLLEHNKINSDIIFTTKEEIGMSDKCVISYVKNLDYNPKLIVLDTSPYPDFKDKNEGFITLRHGDERSGFDKGLIELVKSKLEKRNIPFDFKPSFIGRTELGKVSKETNGELTGVTIQLPSLNYHSNYETAMIDSLENYVRIVEEIEKE